MNRERYNRGIIKVFAWKSAKHLICKLISLEVINKHIFLFHITFTTQGYLRHAMCVTTIIYLCFCHLFNTSHILFWSAVTIYVAAYTSRFLASSSNKLRWADFLPYDFLLLLLFLLLEMLPPSSRSKNSNSWSSCSRRER